MPSVNIAGNSVNIVLIIGASVGGFILIVLVGCVLYFKRKNKIENELKELEMSEEKSDEKRLAKRHRSMQNSSLTIIDVD